MTDQVAVRFGRDHPEHHCHRCGGANLPWSAPSPLWNEVMRGGDINADTELHDGIVCPTCFMVLAEQAGIAELWRLDAKRVHRELQTVTPSGRVWNEQTWKFEDAGDIHRPTAAYLPIGSPHTETCMVCDEPWPCPEAASPETIRLAVAAILGEQ